MHNLTTEPAVAATVKGSQSPLAVSATNFSAFYPTVGGEQIHALADFTLDVEDGEFVVIIGPSGCGKSTFLRTVADLHDTNHAAGKLTVCGGPPRSARLSRQIGFMFQQPALLPWRTVIENVNIPLEVAQIDKPRITPREMLKLVGLAGFEKALPRECSGGMRQRVAMARSLMLQPSVLLLDEPFAAVDEFNRDRLNLALQDIWAATNPAVLYVTHSVMEAVFLADRIVVMSVRPGRVRGIIEIPFERPRSLDLRTTVEFFHLMNKARGLFQQEPDIPHEYCSAVRK